MKSRDEYLLVKLKHHSLGIGSLFFLLFSLSHDKTDNMGSHDNLEQI